MGPVLDSRLLLACALAGRTDISVRTCSRLGTIVGGERGARFHAMEMLRKSRRALKKATFLLKKRSASFLDTKVSVKALVAPRRCSSLLMSIGRRRPRLESKQ